MVCFPFTHSLINIYLVSKPVFVPSVSISTPFLRTRGPIPLFLLHLSDFPIFFLPHFCLPYHKLILFALIFVIFRGFFFSGSLSSFSLVSLCCRALTGVSHCLKVPRRGCLCFRLFRTIFLILDPTFSAYPLLSATISFSTSTSFLPLSFESSPFPALVYPQTRLLHHTLPRRLRLYLLFIPHTHTSRKDQEYCRVSGREYSKRAGTK